MRLLLSAAIFGLALLTSTHSYAFSASFKWCTGSSPLFSLSGVPKGTATLSFHMFDHQAAFNHGGGDVRYTGQKTVPCGSLHEWTGPFPPPGATHTYEFTIKALDSAGNVLGTANPSRDYPERP